MAAVGWSFTPLAGDRTLKEVLLIFILTGVPALAHLYAGYRLPRTEIHPDLFVTIVKWCLGGIGVVLGILSFVELVARMSDSVTNVLILTSLASVAGLGMGFHDARAKTRALNAEERRREAERYSRELERYEIIVETVNDGIFVVDGTTTSRWSTRPTPRWSVTTARNFSARTCRSPRRMT